jgi:hypothetical protein
MFFHIAFDEPRIVCTAMARQVLVLTIYIFDLETTRSGSLVGRVLRVPRFLSF